MINKFYFMNDLKQTTKTLDDFLKESLSASDYLNLNEKLNVSKKMLTMIKEDPKKITVPQLVGLANITNTSVDHILSYISI